MLVPPGDSSAFTLPCPFGYNESNPPADGDGIWFGFVQLGHTRAATPAGSLLTTLIFNALEPTPSTPVTMYRTAPAKPGYPPPWSKVNQGTYDVLNTLSDPANITIVPEPAASTLTLTAALLWVSRKR